MLLPSPICHLNYLIYLFIHLGKTCQASLTAFPKAQFLARCYLTYVCFPMLKSSDEQSTALLLWFVSIFLGFSLCMAFIGSLSGVNLVMAIQNALLLWSSWQWDGYTHLHKNLLYWTFATAQWVTFLCSTTIMSEAELSIKMKWIACDVVKLRQPPAARWVQTTRGSRITNLRSCWLQPEPV